MHNHVQIYAYIIRAYFKSHGIWKEKKYHQYIELKGSIETSLCLIYFSF